MKEKKLCAFLSKATILTVILLCSIFVSAEPEKCQAAENTSFDRQDAKTLLQQEKFKVSKNSITLQSSDSANGIMIAGDAADYSDAVFSFTDSFDFGTDKAEYLIIDALAERKKTIQLAFYLDDASEPFATVNLAKQKKKEIWSTVKNRCVTLSEKSMTGKHKLSFKVVTSETGSVKLAFRSVTFLKSDIPMVEFNLDESQGTIAEMNGDSDHDTECYGEVTIHIPDNYKSEYSNKEFKTETYQLDYIRGRGNSTWQAEKKPYKIKLEKKQNLLGMGKNKHWVLLANYYDVTMLRNKFTYWLGEQLGMEFTPKCEFVDVIMNGEYLGSYYLCEQVRVGESRVDIDDLEKDEETKKATDAETVSGGYLLGMSPYGNESGQVISTDQGLRFLIESPSFEDYLNETQLNYITNYVQKTEDAIYGEDFKDESGKSYTEYMDVDSAVDYYWIQEISLNGDAFGSTSTYLYKKRNGKLYWGPLWDFDYVAWGATEYYDNYYTGFQQNNAAWYGRLFDDEEFYQKVVARWPKIKAKLLEACADGGQIDLYSKKQYESQKHNYEVWQKYSDTYGSWWFDDAVLDDTVKNITYDSEVERFKTWIKERVQWIDANLDRLRKTYHTVKFMVDDTEFASIQVEDGNVTFFPTAPQKDGYVFKGWYATLTEDGVEYELNVTESTAITEDMTLHAKWEEKTETVPVQQIGFSRDDYYMFQNDYLTIGYCVLPFNADAEELVWSSSNPDVVMAYDGMITSVSRVGEAVITAVADNGVTASCTVHVIDYSDYEEIRSIDLDATELSVKPGGYAQIKTMIHPAKAIYQNIMFASSDESIVKVNDCGYVYGVKEGTAVVVCCPYYGTDMKFCKVTVTEEGTSLLSPLPETPTQTTNAVKKGTRFTNHGLKYKVLSVGNKKTAACVGVKNKNCKKITVPAAVTYKNKTYQVTVIGRQAFAGCRKLTEVVAGKNITRIGSKALANCTKLKKLTIRSAKVKKTGANILQNNSGSVILYAPKEKLAQYKKMLLKK